MTWKDHTSEEITAIMEQMQQAVAPILQETKLDVMILLVGESSDSMTMTKYCHSLPLAPLLEILHKTIINMENRLEDKPERN